ncbi:MAG: DUF748 domain-containing protein [Deltaproteobacteria bacterium]|nr:DUF748 domain-containing protein [Deltaproteobacteria bacterium]
MASFSRKLKQIRWYQWLLAVLVLIYITYIALAYLYLPDKLKQVAEADVSNLIGRQILAERFDFNPFVLSLEVKQLSIADKPGRPLIGWQRLYVNFSFWKSIFTWKISLKDLVLNQPEINMEKNQERFNFSDIVERLSAQEKPETSSGEPPDKNSQMALEILHIAINQGVFRYTDLSGVKPAHSNMEDMNIEVEDLYLATGDEHLNPFALKAKIPGGGDLRISGQYRVDPLHFDAEVAADAVQLATFSAFMENIIPIKVSNGLLSVNTRITAKQENEFQLRAEQGRVFLTDLKLDDDISDPPMLHAGAVSINEVTLALPQQDVTVGSVTLDGIAVNQWLDETGKFRYERLITKDEEEASQDIPDMQQTSTPPWNILIKEMNLKNSTLNFSDQDDEITRGHSLTGITLNLENFTFTPGNQTLMRFIAMFDEQGKVSGDGTMTFSPLSVNLNYQLGEIGLPPFSEYLEKISFMRIEKGRLTLDGNMILEAEDGTFLNAALDINLDGLQVEDTRTDDPLISMQAFKLDGIEVNTSNQRMSIASVGLVKPEVFFRISKDKKMTLTSLMKENEAATQGSDVAKETGGSNDWAFSIQKITLQDGTIQYTDHSVKPMFKTGIYDLDVDVDQIATDRVEPTPFSMTSKIDQYAPLTIKGTLDSLHKQPGMAFACQLKGLDMPYLSPYSATYIGNNLKSGQLSLALDYTLQDHKMKGKNNIVAKNLYLGEKVPSETAIKAPVALGLALLRDVNGVIDLNVGLSGDLDDPEFSLSGIVVKVLVNIIVKAAASPFKLLGALVGGREDLGEVHFASGLAELDQENQDRLKGLAEALTKRPQLAVRVKGNADHHEDAVMLQNMHLKGLLASSRKISLDALQAEAADKALWMVPENRDILDKINIELNLPGTSDRVSRLKAENPNLKGEALEAEVYRRIYDDVRSAQEISMDEILSLADGRALTIKQYLVDILKLDHERVSLIKAQKEELTGRVVSLEIEAI